jgi:hypothetical protein
MAAAVHPAIERAFSPSTADTMNAAGRQARNGTFQRSIRITVVYPPAMAKAPCARLTKFINPRVTASPQASTNSNMP